MERFRRSYALSFDEQGEEAEKEKHELVTTIITITGATHWTVYLDLLRCASSSDRPMTSREFLSFGGSEISSKAELDFHGLKP